MIQGHMNPFLQHLQGRTLELRDIELLRDAFQIQEKRIEQQRLSIAALRDAKESADSQVALLENEVARLTALTRAATGPTRIAPRHTQATSRAV